MAAGTPLAQVGRTGTIRPHLHFDLRGPSWHISHPVRFRVAKGKVKEVVEGNRFRSGTILDAFSEGSFSDSVLKGDEFIANHVRFRSRGRAFWLPVHRRIVFEGSVLKPARTVGFYLFKTGRKSEYLAEVTPDANGRFRIETVLPESARGDWWWRLTIRDMEGHYPNTATLPARVD